MVMAPSTANSTEARNYSEIRELRFVGSKEAELLECLRSGEDSCYEILVRKLGPQVLATAQRYLRSEADAADCFQDTFLAVFEGINNFEQRSSLSTWIRGITIRQCLDEFFRYRVWHGVIRRVERIVSERDDAAILSDEVSALPTHSYV